MVGAVNKSPKAYKQSRGQERTETSTGSTRWLRAFQEDDVTGQSGRTKEMRTIFYKSSFGYCYMKR